MPNLSKKQLKGKKDVRLHLTLKNTENWCVSINNGAKSSKEKSYRPFFKIWVSHKNNL